MREFSASRCRAGAASGRSTEHRRRRVAARRCGPGFVLVDSFAHCCSFSSRRLRHLFRTQTPFISADTSRETLFRGAGSTTRGSARAQGRCPPLPIVRCCAAPQCDHRQHRSSFTLDVVGTTGATSGVRSPTADRSVERTVGPRARLQLLCGPRGSTRWWVRSSSPRRTARIVDRVLDIGICARSGGCNRVGEVPGESCVLDARCRLRGGSPRRGQPGKRSCRRPTRLLIRCRACGAC